MRHSTVTMALATMFLAACAPTASTAPAVEQFGAMRAVMRDGDSQPRIRLADAVAAPHAFAVGALEALAGEVTIVDGDVWVSRVADGGLAVTGPRPASADRATLLTLAHVAAWRTTTIETPAEGAELEALIEAAARDAGLDTERPFPFVIEGESDGLSLHVINGYCLIATDPSSMDAEPWRWSSAEPTPVVIVGFYAANAGGVMTHHGTRVHAHAVLSIDGRTVAGHVDRVEVAAGMALRMPRPGHSNE